jgi:phosphopantothenoylcysteine decarboxylase/phosphopantothenate--cysteine ligase
MLKGKRILLIITGSIAAYKSLDLIRLLTKAGASVEGVLTKGGTQFVTPLSVETLTGKKAHIEMWDENSYEMNHIELSRRADLIVVAPATADYISKMIHGEGDDLASSIMLAKNKPVILAPSMNVEMWDNPAFQRNLTAARTDGAHLVSPQIDTLACGEVGIGKMAEPTTIFKAVEAHFALESSLEGKNAIVTSGATIERIDSVRFLSNFSSGKQGNAIALALANAGAQVTLISGRTSEAAPLHSRITTIKIESAADMLSATHQALPADIFVGCAAVCDFAIANRADHKIKKSEGLQLEFEENPDIARSIGTLASTERPQIVVGFAAETDQLINYARKKLTDKGCDLIVANDISGGAVFGHDENQASFVTRESVETLDTMSKEALGQAIASWIAQALQIVEA